MKRLLFVLMSLFVITVCSAQVALQVNENGEYRERPDSFCQWLDIKITTNSLALKYNQEFPEAISNPGKKFW